MRTALLGLIASATMALSASAASAGHITFADAGSNLRGVLDGIAVDGDFDLDVTTDYLHHPGIWGISAAGGAFTTLIEVAAGSGAPFGIYDITNPARRVTLFAAGTAGDSAAINMTNTGSVLVNGVDSGVDFTLNQFGFFLNGLSSQRVLNDDGQDHVAVYRGTGSEFLQIGPWAPGRFEPGDYILAWETGGIRDFADFVMIIGSAHPAPEPATIALLSAGLIGLGLRRRRR